MRQIAVISENWHLGPLAQNNTTQVNPRPVDYMDSVVTKQGTMFLYKASQEEGGALFSPAKGTDPDIPIWAKSFLYCRRVKYIAPWAQGQDEFDVKYTLAAGQINLSNQINFNRTDRKAMWQWDPNDPPKWVDTGFDVASLIHTDDWNDFMYHGSLTPDGKGWKLDMMACNGTLFPGTGQVVPLKTGTGWTPQKAHPQEQAQVMGAPGYTGKLYGRTQIVVSDSGMPLQWY